MLQVMQRKVAINQQDDLPIPRDEVGERWVSKVLEVPLTLNDSSSTSLLVSHVPVSIGSNDASVTSIDSSSSSTSSITPTANKQEDSSMMKMVHQRASISDPYESFTESSLLPSPTTHHNIHGERPTKRARKSRAECNPKACPNAAAQHPGISPVSLSTPEDEKELNELHCFVRRSLEFFSANEDDVSAPAPGRKTRVCLGQVGIRCIHCKSLPINKRKKRSVCYPPTVDGIYHAVSNMKHDHFAVCTGLSEASRKAFTDVRALCTRRTSTSSSSTTTSSSTNSAPKQHSKHSTSLFYTQSAKDLGLVDTTSGVRFSDGIIQADFPKILPAGQQHPLPLNTSLDKPSAFSALVMAACQVGLQS
jgi:hypothetical protein